MPTFSLSASTLVYAFLMIRLSMSHLYHHTSSQIDNIPLDATKPATKFHSTPSFSVLTNTTP